jgi:hypothetical protein
MTPGRRIQSSASTILTERLQEALFSGPRRRMLASQGHDPYIIGLDILLTIFILEVWGLGVR